METQVNPLVGGCKMNAKYTARYLLAVGIASLVGYKIIIIYRKELLIVWHLPYKQVNQFHKICYFKALMSYI
jgi:hypothetical protein